MSISSMTGFARVVGHDGTLGWTWEVKSVNGRSLDIRFRLPPGFDRIEVAGRGLAVQRFKRGSLAASLSLVRAVGTTSWRINRDLIEQLLALHKDFSGRIARSAPRLDALLAVRGVVEPVEELESAEAAERRATAIITSFEEALAALAAAREAEGARLAAVLGAQLDEIASLTAEAEGIAALRPDALKARIREQVAALLEAQPSLPEERLAQELALLAIKAAVREELDRLKAHLLAARELIAGGEAVGRRLDFLCQELNREVNTLCAKAAEVALTRVGLGLKAAVDQLREQVQNVE